MDDLINEINHSLTISDPVFLAAFLLWKLNYIHPFINGNGRTARAACYFILCVHAGGWISGEPILPELIKMNRDEYVAALKYADKTLMDGSLDLKPMHEFISKMLALQMSNIPT